MCLLPASCVSAPSAYTPQTLSDPTSLLTTGDADDLDAAAQGGVEEADAVIVDRLAEVESVRRYTIRTTADEPGLLTIERLSRGPDPVRLRVGCAIGRFGDPAREREVVEQVRQRLERLRGVEFAPLR